MAKYKYMVAGGVFCILIATSLSGCGHLKYGSSAAPGSAVGLSSFSGSSSVSSSAAPVSSCVESAASSSQSISSAVQTDEALSSGEFVRLWMQNRGLSKPDQSVQQAVASAEKQGIIPLGVDSGKPLTNETLAYLLTAKKYDFSKLNESHYDWQIADLNSVNSSMKKYVLMAYAKGLLLTRDGTFNPNSKVYLRDAKAALSRRNGQGIQKLPPDQAAPYFEYKGLVEVKRLDPSIVLDLKYATKDNFTGVPHYPRVLCLLEAETAKRLVKANQYFNKRKFTIQIWDAYRPVSVQWSLYYSTPKNLKQYAPAPSKNSQHSKGIAADITLVDQNGNEMKMPTGFDNFTDMAHADYANLPEQVKENRSYLRNGMEQQGFKVYSLEWWHFYLPEKANLSISTVGLDEFAQKENEFYSGYLKGYWKNK